MPEITLTEDQQRQVIESAGPRGNSVRNCLETFAPEDGGEADDGIPEATGLEGTNTDEQDPGAGGTDSDDEADD